MSLIDADDQVTLAIYAHSKNLLNTVGWKKYRKLYDREKKLLRIINQAKLKSYRSSPVYKYGFEVPRDHTHAMDLNRKNGNTKWHDAEQMELAQLDEYNTFMDIGGRALYLHCTRRSQVTSFMPSSTMGDTRPICCRRSPHPNPIR